MHGTLYLTRLLFLLLNDSIQFDLQGHGLYICGIIDILNEYDLQKRFEFYYKRLKNGDYGMSAIPPLEYAQRFLLMMKTRLRIPFAALCKCFIWFLMIVVCIGACMAS